MTTREQWLAERKKGLGGSDAAAALGLNPWKTNVQLWEEKTGRREEEDISEKECVLYGIGAEPTLREMFKLDFPEYEIRHEENKSLVHPQYSCLRASLDGELTDKQGRKGILEIKTTQIQNGGDWAKWKGAVPQHYFIQVLHYLLVTSAMFAILKAQLRADWGGQLRITENHYFFERSDHEEDIAYLLEKELAFWRMVETDTRPDLILPEI